MILLSDSVCPLQADSGTVCFYNVFTLTTVKYFTDWFTATAKRKRKYPHEDGTFDLIKRVSNTFFKQFSLQCAIKC